MRFTMSEEDKTSEEVNEGADKTAGENEGQVGEGAQQTSPESQSEGDSQQPDVETLMQQKKHWEKKAKELEQQQGSSESEGQSKQQAEQQVPQVDEDRLEKIEIMAEGGYRKEELDLAARHRDKGESIRDALQKQDVKDFLTWRRQKNETEQASPGASAPSGSTAGPKKSPSEMTQEEHKKLWEQYKNQQQGGTSGA